MTTSMPTVAKTIKLYINGAFPRTESGRHLPVHTASGSLYAQACLGSRKDLRQAVEAARKAQPAWQSRSAYNRGQILYRMAEMTEGKKQEWVQLIETMEGLDKKAALEKAEAVIATFVYYAGFADKFTQVASTINPVSGPYHCFTAPEALGVVGGIASNNWDLLSMVDWIASTISSGNSIVALFGEKGAPALALLGEIFETSDLPAGVVNMISGDLEELYPHLCQHREVNGVYFDSDESEWTTQGEQWASEHMQRSLKNSQKLQCLANITRSVEFKSVWHPIGL